MAHGAIAEVQETNPDKEPVPETATTDEDVSTSTAPVASAAGAEVTADEPAVPVTEPEDAASSAAGAAAAAIEAGARGEEEVVMVEVDENAHPAISKSKMVEIVAEVVVAAKKLRADIKAQVQAGELLPSMAPAIVQMRIQTLDAKIAEQFSVTKEQIESAQGVYEKDPAIAPSLKVLQEETELAMMGGSGPEATWDEETMIKYINANAAMTVTILQEKKDELLATGATGEEAKMQFVMAMQQMLPHVAMEAMQRIGVDPQEMQTNMMAFRNNQRVMQAIMNSAQNLQGANMEKLSEF